MVRPRSPLGGADEDEGRVPVAAGAQLKADVQPGHRLELAGAGQRADVDRAEADRADEAGDRGLRRLVVPGEQGVHGRPWVVGFAWTLGEQGVERLDDDAAGAAAASRSAPDGPPSVARPE